MKRLRKTIALITAATLAVIPAMSVTAAPTAPTASAASAASEKAEDRDLLISGHEAMDDVEDSQSDAVVESSNADSVNYGETVSCSEEPVAEDISEKNDNSSSNETSDEAVRSSRKGAVVNGAADATAISGPVVEDDITTWDSIWFGKYWQDDTNGDGYCFSHSFTVAEEGSVKTDGNGNALHTSFNGNVGDKVEADSKKPIRWRVLSIDENGEALLLSDKLLDMIEYNITNDDVNWGNCSLRSYLNGYNGTKNIANADYSDNGFFFDAFNETERNALSASAVGYYRNNSEAGNTDNLQTVNDKLFCMTWEELNNEDYGFVDKGALDNYSNYRRLGFMSGYVANKPGYGGREAYEAGRVRNYWTRNPGTNASNQVMTIHVSGHISYNSPANYQYVGVRPALRLNLKNNPDLWSYAGKISSNYDTGRWRNLVNPVTDEEGLTTWDCIWFGEYWQESDSDKDGHVTREDTKDPIKWRVLDIDRNGYALLLSDQILDIVKYNETSGVDSYGNSTLRSYLNSYDGSQNSGNKSYSSTGFAINAFDDGQRNWIYRKSVENKANPVTNTSNGANTQDKVFCLGIQEATEPSYGFVEIEFTDYNTKSDCNRMAMVTSFTDENTSEVSVKAGEPGNWWTRSLGSDTEHAAYVGRSGMVYATNPTSFGLTQADVCIRPVIWMDLGNYGAQFWSYAGKVSSEKIRISKITLPEKETVNVKEKVTLTPEILPDYAQDLDVVWTSENKSIATVENGVVTGVKSGETIITVTSKDDTTIKAQCLVTVLNPVKSVTVTPQEATLTTGETLQLKASVAPADADDQTVIWSSSDKGVATVDENSGLVRAISAGTALITAKSKDGGKEAACQLTVVSGRIPVTGVSLPETALVSEHDTITLSAVVSPENADDPAVEYSTADPAIATVDEYGNVTGHKEGSTIISAKTKDGGLTAQCKLTVTGTILLPGEVRRLNLVKDGMFLYGAKWTVTYADPKVKCITLKNGVITAKNLKKGVSQAKAEVTATLNGVTTVYHVTVDGSIPENKMIEDSGKKYGIKAPKALKLNVGTKKAVAVKIPAQLRDNKYTVEYTISNNSIIAPDMKADRSNPGKAVFNVEPKDAGAAYIVWEMKDEKGRITRAVTKLLIKKSVDQIVIGGFMSDTISQNNVSQNKVSQNKFPEESVKELTMSVGEGRRLRVYSTLRNTDAKDLSFKLSGKGFKISKSGYVSALEPNSSCTVTVKAGKLTKDVTIKSADYKGDTLTFAKPSVNAKLPKDASGKPKTIALKLVSSKKEVPAAAYSIKDAPKGITVDKDGKVTISADASAGCYEIIATAAGYNIAECELIVK